MNRRKQSKAARQFEAVRLVFFGVCSDFHSEFGGDFEEVVSEGHEHFMDVLMSHDPKRGPLEADVRFRVMMRLRMTARKNRRLLKLHPNSPLSPDEVDPKSTRGAREAGPSSSLTEFRVEEFLKRLTDRARSVVCMALDLPSAVRRQVGELPTAAQIRIKLRAYLQKTGWSPWHLSQTFNEIRRALNG